MKLRSMIQLSVLFLIIVNSSIAQVSYGAWWIGMKSGTFSYTPFQYSFVETAGKGSPLALTGYINDQYKYKNWNLGIEMIKPYYSIMVQTSNPIKSSVLEKDPWNYKLSNNNFWDMRFAAGPSMWHHRLSLQLGLQVNGFRNSSFTTTGIGRAAYTSTANVEGLNYVETVQGWAGGFSANLYIAPIKKLLLRATTSWNKFNNKSRFQNGSYVGTEVFLYFIPKRSGKSNWGINLGWVQQQYNIKGFGMDQPLTGSSGIRAAPAIRMKNSAILLNVNIPVRFWDED